MGRRNRERRAAKARARARATSQARASGQDGQRWSQRAPSAGPAWSTPCADAECVRIAFAGAVAAELKGDSSAAGEFAAVLAATTPGSSFATPPPSSAERCLGCGTEMVGQGGDDRPHGGGGRALARRAAGPPPIDITLEELLAD